MATCAFMSRPKLWKCDVCLNATFTDFEEACRHEDECAAKLHEDTPTRQPEVSLKQLNEITVKKQQPTQLRQKTVAPKKELQSMKMLEEQPPKKKGATVHPFFGTKKPSQVNCLAPSRTEFQKKRRHPNAAASIVVAVDSDLSDHQAIAPAKKQKKGKNHAAAESLDLTNSDRSKDSCHSGTKRRVDSVSLPLASIFGGRPRSEILAEQRAIELATKRRLAMEKERQLKQSRAQVVVTKKKVSVVSVYEPKQHISERFPAFSHVGVRSTGTTHASPRIGRYAEARSALCKTPNHPSGEKVAVAASFHQMMRTPELRPPSDPILQILASTLVPPKAIDQNDHRLWTDKYNVQNVPFDICGSMNKEIATSCITFVSDWKVERQKAHERRAEKQEKLVLGKVKRKSRKKSIHDDCWGDSDDDGELPAICLLTGPVGCGKSSLVHAVAKECECKLMEINTTEKRGSQNLRNAIEEATQSDSTLELLRNHGVPTSIFGKNKQDLIDSDDEKDGFAVPVILFDEADLLFDEDGDSGFWLTLKHFSKKAKCPIFLTATTLPQALISMSIHFKHHIMDRPTPRESVSKLWQIIKNEGIERREGVNCDEAKRALETFSELCECDVRRMINELQLFSKSQNKVKAVPREKKPLSTLNFESDITLPEKKVPRVLDINPKVVNSNQHTLLTISGTNFLSLVATFSVSVGNQRCPVVKVIDDSTILAICPPCKLPRELDTYGMFKSSAKRCRTIRYPIVTITTSPGVQHLRSGVKLLHQELFDGSNITRITHFTIEYRFPQSEWSKNESSESEFIDEPELEGNEPVPKNSKITDHSMEQSDDAFSQIAKAQQDSSVVESMATDAMNVPTCNLACDELLMLADRSQYQSDIAFLADNVVGLPFLAGASKGLGAAFVDGFGISSTESHKLCRNENARPPSTERILLSGWNEEGCFFGNCDSYMTPPSVRERRLLSQSALFGRCAATATQNQGGPDDNEIEGEYDQGDIHFTTFPCNPDEDALLLRDDCLPSLLVTLRSMLYDSTCIEELHNNLMSMRRSNAVVQTCHFLGRLFSEQALCCMLTRGMGQALNGCLVAKNDDVDERIFLDYSPILSEIGTFEKLAIAAFEGSLDLSSETLHRRTTRQTKTMRRAHYFGLLNSEKNSFEEDFRDMGEKRAEYLLHYS